MPKESQSVEMGNFFLHITFNRPNLPPRIKDAPLSCPV